MLSGKLRAATGGAVGESWTYAESLSKGQTVWGPSGGVIYPYITNTSNSVKYFNGTEFGILARESGFATTTDGTAWSYWVNTTTDAFVGSNFRAIGSDGSAWMIGGNDYYLWYSADKITWTNYWSYLTAAGWPTGGYPAWGILWDGTNWLVLCGDGMIATSAGTNLTSWTITYGLRTLVSAANTNVNSINKYNGLYVAWGDTFYQSKAFLATSPDGVNWTTRITATGDCFECLVWTGLQFVAVTFNGLVYTSTNGTTWTSNTGAQTALTTFSAGWESTMVWDGTKLVLMVQTGQVLTSTNGTTWTLNNSLSSNSNWGARRANSIAYVNSKYVVVGGAGTTYQTATTAQSTDLTTWTFPDTLTQTATTFGRNRVTKIVWSGTQYIAQGYFNYALANSPDGINWTNNLTLFNTTSFTSGNSSLALYLTWGNNKFLIYKYIAASGIYTGYAYSSPDGLTWSVEAGFTSTFGSAYGIISAGTYVGNKFLICFQNGNFGASIDGTTWVDTGAPWGSTTSAPSFVWSGTTYLAINIYGVAVKTATSPDGLTWTNQPDSITKGVNVTSNATFWDGSRFVAVSSNGYLWTSPTGVTWTLSSDLRNALVAASSANVNAATWCGTFCIVNCHNGKIAKSYDLITWTINDSLMQSAWGTTYQPSTVETQSVNWNGAQLVIGGRNGKLAVST